MHVNRWEIVKKNEDYVKKSSDVIIDITRAKKWFKMNHPGQGNMK